MADRKLHYGWVVIFIGLLVLIGAQGFGRMSPDVLLAMSEGLHLQFYTEAGLLNGGHTVSTFLPMIVGGFLAAKFGARIVLVLALTLTGIAIILTGVAETWGFAFAMRVLTGLGSGAAYIPALALGSAWFAATRRGLATGIVAAGIGGGTAIAGFVVPVILRAYGTEGWRFAWYYQGAAVLVIAGLAAFLIRSMPEEMGLRQVGAGKQVETEPPQDAPTAPLQWRKAYRTKAVWYLGLIFFWYAISQDIFSLWFWGPNYFRAVKSGLNPAIWLPGVGGIFCGVLWGGLSDKLGRGSTMALGYMVPGICFGIFALLPMSWGFYLSAIIFGLTASSILTVMAATTGDYAGPRLAPAVLAFVTIFYGIGHFIGSVATLHLWATFSGAFTASILLGGGLSLIGVVLSLGMKRIRYEES